MKTLRKWYNYYLSSDKNFTRSIKHLTGFLPVQLPVYRLALQHSSVADEMHDNNERLEFLGDAVLDVIISGYLFKKYPLKREGFLTQMRSKVVSRNHLNEAADRLGLQNFISFGYSDKMLKNSSVLGNALEALVGAIYIDLGYKKTREFVMKKLLQTLDWKELEEVEVNFKSRLLEWAQKKNKIIKFKILDESGTAHRKKFTSGIFLDDSQISEGEAYTKKEADQIAAKKAVEKLSLIPKTE